MAQAAAGKVDLSAQRRPLPQHAACIFQPCACRGQFGRLEYLRLPPGCGLTGADGVCWPLTASFALKSASRFLLARSFSRVAAQLRIWRFPRGRRRFRQGLRCSRFGSCLQLGHCRVLIRP